MSMHNESHARSIAKALSWRVLGTLATSLLVFVFTRKVAVSLAVGALEFASKIGLYWLHERVWTRVPFGRHGGKRAVLWFTGLSGSGKSTIAVKVVEELRRRGDRVEHLDGDTIRSVFPDIGFSHAERDAHIRRIGFLASRLEKNGVTVVASLISPYEESRSFVRGLCDNFIEIYVATPLEECERRDVKGLYARARRGDIKNFTGIDDPYEVPVNPEVTIDTREMSVDEAAAVVLNRAREKKRNHHGAPERHRSAQHLHPAGSVRQLQTAGDAVVDRKG
jgi:adenylylsulfate kinase